MAKNSLQRQRIWLHNSFLGHAMMMQKQAMAIQQAETTTKESKMIALKIAELSVELSASLKKRVD